jgi:hypothetical protein
VRGQEVPWGRYRRGGDEGTGVLLWERWSKKEEVEICRREKRRSRGEREEEELYWRGKEEKVF